MAAVDQLFFPKHDRISGIMLHRGKLLLVTGYEEVVYWTPGGKKENPDESDFDTLQRELKEELSLQILKSSFYLQYPPISKDGQWFSTKGYIVEWQGEIIPKNEITKVSWFGKEDIETRAHLIAPGTKEHLLPKLIKDGLVF